MHNVKIEFCPLDWYSSSPTTIVLYKKMYIKYFISNRQKLKTRKCDLHEISSASSKAVLLNLFYSATHILARICFGVQFYQDFSSELRNRYNCKQQNYKKNEHAIYFLCKT